MKRAKPSLRAESGAPLTPLTPAFALLAAALAMPLMGAAKEAKEIAAEMSVLVESSLGEYQTLERTISEEKAPLVSTLTSLEQANLELRSEVESYRFLGERARAETQSLSEEQKRLQDKNEYVLSAFDNFLAKFDSRINAAEGQLYFDQLSELRVVAGDAGRPVGERYQSYVEALKLSLARAEEAIGGSVHPGRALDREGRIHDGQVAIFGPSAFFVSDDGARGGVLGFNAGAIEPRVEFLNGDEGVAIAGLFTQGSGSLPLDATLGDALSLRATRGDVFQHVRQGGFVGYAILILGGIALVVSLLKLRDLRGFATASADELYELSRTARQDGIEAAIAKAKAMPGIASEVLATGIRNINKNALLLEETMLSVILRARPRMERYLPFLAIAAAASPLLGLLGTVVGLIKTFALITLYGAGAPKALSSGISEALITTELGLIVAIPTLILHGLFSRVIRTRLGVLEQTAFDFVEAANAQKAEVMEKGS